MTYQGFSFSCRVRQCVEPATDPIVVISGLYQDADTFLRFERLWSTATVVTVGLPGLSAADPVPARFGYELSAEALAHAMDVLALPQVNLVGVSHGYPAAYRYALAHPGRIARLVLSGPPDWSPALRHNLRELDALLVAGDLTAFAQRAVDLFLCGDATRDVYRSAVLRRALTAKLSSISERQRSRFISATRRAANCPPLPAGGLRRVPTLCVSGEHDALAPATWLRILAGRIEGASVLRIRAADHLSFQERPTEWAEVVSRFCAGASMSELDFLVGPEPYESVAA